MQNDAKWLRRLVKLNSRGGDLMPGGDTPAVVGIDPSANVLDVRKPNFFLCLVTGRRRPCGASNVQFLLVANNKHRLFMDLLYGRLMMCCIDPLIAGRCGASHGTFNRTASPPFSGGTTKSGGCRAFLEGGASNRRRSRPVRHSRRIC